MELRHGATIATLLVGLLWANPAHPCGPTWGAHLADAYPSEDGVVTGDEAITFVVDGMGTFDGLTVTDDTGEPVEHDLEFYRSTSVDPDTQALGIIRPKEPWTDGSVTVEFAFSGSGEYTSPQSEIHAVQTAADSDDPVFGADTIHNVRWRRVERGEDSFCGPSANNSYADWITYTIEQDGDETLTHFQLVTAVDAAGDEQTFASTYGPSYRDFDHEFGVALPDDTACIEVRPVSISGAIGDPVETCSPKFRNENGRPMPAKACAAAGGSRPSGLWVLFGVVLLLVRRRDWMTTSN